MVEHLTNNTEIESSNPAISTKGEKIAKLCGVGGCALVMLC